MSLESRPNGRVAKAKEALKVSKDILSKPSEIQILDRFIDRGIKNFPLVPCSITDTMENLAEQRHDKNELKLLNTTHEHALAGIAAGVWLGSGELSAIHMQNSGLTNSADGIISFARVYGIPMVALVTWRGSNEKDDSEPHQEIGKRTEKLSRAVFDKDVHGSRMGRGILKAVDNAINTAYDGGIGVVRLSPEAFNKKHKPVLEDFGEFDVKAWEENYQKIKETKGNASNPFRDIGKISRDEAIHMIIEEHPNAAILFCNGFTARAAQAANDRLGNFYNVGYMGGTLAIGWGAAMSNPDMEFVVVDGDQNAQMSTMNENLEEQYPDNLYRYVLNNRKGSSVGYARSINLSHQIHDTSRIIQIDADDGKFAYPRVGKKGMYFDTDEAQAMSDLIGPLPTHTKRFKNWVEQETYKKTSMREFKRIMNGNPALGVD